MTRARAISTMATRAGEPDAVEELTERIERVATRLFIRNGYHGVSYLGIAKELGITHSNVHYYYRTKPALAEAVLKRVAANTLAVTSRIWREPGVTLAQKFARMRDWIHQSYLEFNPDGKGGRPWGLLSRFSMESDALNPEMRQVIRATLKKQEADIRLAVDLAVQRGEFRKDAPADGIALQVLSVIHLTGQITRYSSGFARLDELLMWTITTLTAAYGTADQKIDWPAPGTAVANHQDFPPTA
jgi:AcrR family transcriptional regulator